MPILELVSLLILAAFAWLWFDSFKAREIGVSAARSACSAEGLQLLDEAVALASLKPARDEDGRLVLGRVYDFEYSDTGDNRRSGSVMMLGQEVIIVRLASAVPTLH